MQNLYSEFGFFKEVDEQQVSFEKIIGDMLSGDVSTESALYDIRENLIAACSAQVEPAGYEISIVGSNICISHMDSEFDKFITWQDEDIILEFIKACKAGDEVACKNILTDEHV